MAARYWAYILPWRYATAGDKQTSRMSKLDHFITTLNVNYNKRCRTTMAACLFYMFR